MKASKIFRAGPKVLSSLITGRSIPLIVGWYLTYRCNRDCGFCGLRSADVPELPTEDVLAILDRLGAAGTQVIVFSGGEPLILEDIGKILAHAKSRGISPGITTNGAYLPERIDEIALAASIKISFEGPKQVHDRIRGQGSYDQVIAAVEACKSRGLSPILNTTLNKYNLPFVSEIVDIAGRLGVRVKFQPVSTAHTLGKQIDDFYPEPETMQKTLRQLRLLRKTRKEIANTDPGLAYMATWPNPPRTTCRGGQLFLRLDPAGRSFFCTMQRDNFSEKSILQDGVKATMEGLKQRPCAGCWCTSTLELNLFLEGGWLRPWQILRFFEWR